MGMSLFVERKPAVLGAPVHGGSEEGNLPHYDRLNFLTPMFDKKLKKFGRKNSFEKELIEVGVVWVGSGAGFGKRTRKGLPPRRRRNYIS